MTNGETWCNWIGKNDELFICLYLIWHVFFFSMSLSLFLEALLLMSLWLSAPPSCFGFVYPTKQIPSFAWAWGWLPVQGLFLWQRNEVKTWKKVDGGGRFTLSEKIAGCVGTFKAQQNHSSVHLWKECRPLMSRPDRQCGSCLHLGWCLEWKGYIKRLFSGFIFQVFTLLNKVDSCALI